MRASSTATNPSVTFRLREFGLMAGLLSLVGVASCGGGGAGEAPPDPNAVASVFITAPAITLSIGGKTVALSAQALNSSGLVVGGKTFVWATSSGSIATVASDGVVTAVGVGSVTITATTDGKVGSVALTVIGQVPASLTIVNGNGQSGSVGAFIGPKDPGFRV